ncbi:MAG: PIG-L family deacetylase [Victivallaceae bacterium]|nr:PIG-L family deacetylase [Victivallaceae bacterium]
MKKIAFAVGCHPDDIEFMMSGTLMRLKAAGYEIHYMNVANGSCGSDTLPAAEIIRIRRDESIEAAASIGAVYHESIANDLEVFYERDLLFKLGAIMREVEPDIILTHSPVEYMEDHSNTCRLAVSAAFTRGMKNFPTIPATATIAKPVTLYHCLPYGLQTPLCEPVTADVYIDVTAVMDKKAQMLSCHKSQKEWLDVSQGMDSYLTTMAEQCQAIGQMSGKFNYAEGWRRHLHLGFCNIAADPLAVLN